MTTRTVSEARAELPSLLTRVADGEEVVITRHGQPVAVLVRPEALRVRRAERALREAEQLAELLEQARNNDPPTGEGLSRERADELVAGLYAGRRD